RASEPAVLRLELTCFPDASLEELEMETLGFYLNGESAIIHTLYELLCRNCSRILVRDPLNSKTLCELPASQLQPVGFGENEEVLPYPRRSFLGYRLLQEYFAFPEKFFFMTLSGLSQLRAAGFTSQAEVLFLISPFEADEQQRLEGAVNVKTVRLGCSPVIN